VTESDKNPRELRWTDRYSGMRAKITGLRLAALEQAESEIAEDPMHRFWRRPTVDGATLDYMAADSGLLIKFRAVSDGLVILEDLIDLSMVR
jgi:hypothetical protein